MMNSEKGWKKKFMWKIENPYCRSALRVRFHFIFSALLIFNYFFLMPQVCCKSLPSIIFRNEKSTLNAALWLVGRWIASRKCKESRPRHWPDFSPSACRLKTAGSEYFLLPVSWATPPRPSTPHSCTRKKQFSHTTKSTLLSTSISLSFCMKFANDRNRVGGGIWIVLLVCVTNSNFGVKTTGCRIGSQLLLIIILVSAKLILVSCQACLWQDF